MKRFTRLLLSVILVLAMLIPAAMAESTPADDFLGNLSRTWDSFLVMAGDVADSASKSVATWAEESGVSAFLDEAGRSIGAWAEESGLNAFLSDAQQSVSAWADESGFNAWAQSLSEETQKLIEKNRPAVEAWLAGAGEEVRHAWDTLVNAREHTQQEVMEALETVDGALDTVD